MKCYQVTKKIFAFFLASLKFREGNGNPLQYSCLENPMDGGVWRAAVYGVTQSGTQMKRFTSSSSSNSLKLPMRTMYQSTEHTS